MPIDQCDAQIGCDGRIPERLARILSPEIIERIKSQTVRIRELTRQLDELERKGPNKSAEDLVDIERIQDELDELSDIELDLPLSICEPIKEEPERFHHDGQEYSSSAGPLLERVQSNGDTFTTAETNMFASAWSSDFLHGSDTLMPLVNLARGILQDDERIKGIQRVTWKKPMTSNMQLAVMRGEQAPDPQAAMEGIIKTSKGVLSFAGRLIDSPITRHTVPNPYVANSICGCRECVNVSRDGTHRFQIREPITTIGLTSWEEAIRDPAIQAASLAEMVTMAMTKIDIPQCRRAVLRLMGGLSDLRLASNPEQMFSGRTLDIRVASEEIKTGKSGFTIIPFTYMFPHQTSASRGFAAMTDSKHLSNEKIRDK